MCTDTSLTTMQAETEEEKAALTPAGLSVADEEERNTTLGRRSHPSTTARWLPVHTPRSLMLSVSVCECKSRPHTLTPNP